MAQIRVNPQDLIQKSADLTTVTVRLRDLTEEVKTATGNAPLYDGQFAPIVSAIGWSAIVVGNKRTNSLADYSRDLVKRSSFFLDADQGGVFGLGKGNIFNWLDINTNILLNLSMMLGFGISAVLQLLRLGALFNKNGIIGLVPGGILPDGAVYDPGKVTCVDEGTKFEKPDILDGGGVSRSDYSQLLIDQTDYPNDIMNNITGETIKWYGCLISCVAMVARYYGAIDAIPRDVDNYIDQKGGYAKNPKTGEPGSYFPGWDKATNYINSETDKNIKFTKNVSLSEVDGHIQNNEPVVIHIKSSSPDGHWVVAVGIDKDGNYICLDMNGGVQRTISADQIHSDRRNVVFYES
jgi:hypothetical protein